MWRKIHSNRDPRDTLYSEVRKEFKTYFDKSGGFLAAHLEARPKLYFRLMVLIMIVSVVLVFAIFRQPVTPKLPVQKSLTAPVADGFTQIMSATARIRQTLQLKHMVDSISSKKVLSPADSIALDSALNSLQQIHSLNH